MFSLCIIQVFSFLSWFSCHRWRCGCSRYPWRSRGQYYSRCRYRRRNINCPYIWVCNILYNKPPQCSNNILAQTRKEQENSTVFVPEQEQKQTACCFCLCRPKNRITKANNSITEQKNKISLMRYLKYKRKAVFVCLKCFCFQIRLALILVCLGKWYK